MLRRRVGHRGACLLFFAILDLIYGTILVTLPTPIPGTNILNYINHHWPPLPVWGGAWITVGLVCAIHAFRYRDTPGFVAAMFIKFSWATAYAWAWLDGAGLLALAGAAIWTMTVALVAIIATWPEVPAK